MMFLKTGEKIQDAETGADICTVKRDIGMWSVISADDFGDFAEGERPWQDGEVLDPRCVREAPNGFQMFVEGAWRDPTRRMA